MFLNYSLPIEWSPEFFTLLFQDNFYLISEQKQYAIPSQMLSQIPLWIEEQTAITKAISSLSAEDTIRLYQKLDTFYSQGVIRNTQPSNWSTLDISKPIVVTDHHGFSLYDLCDAHTNSEIMTLLKTLSEQFNCNIIVLNDYLDPRLQALSFSDGANLMIKLTNKQHYIGPFFKHAQPCFYCMQHSVGRNQPLRIWLQKKHKKAVVLPHRLNAITPAYQSYIIEQLKTLLLSGLENEIIEISAANTHRVQHYWHHFTHCPKCNVKVNNNQITLKSCLKHNAQQGGCRHLPPEQTLQNIRPLIGPLTGIISSANVITEQKNLPYKTYQSSFFRAIPSSADPLNYCNELTSLGKGISDAQAEVSALCESFERYGAHYQSSDTYLLASYNDLQGKAVDPEILMGLSDKQKASFEEIDYPVKRASQGALEYAPNRQLHWHPAWSLSNQQSIYVPMCYALAGAPMEIKYCAWNSNGCAAGNTQEEAILQGFLEVVERDAIAVWWYNKIQLPEVSLSLLPQNQNLKLQQTLALDWEYWVLDATHDFEIPVFAALACDKKTGRMLFGFGCHLSPKIAIERAITELCQLICVADKHSAPFDFDNIKKEKHLFANTAVAMRTKEDYADIMHTDICDDIDYCIEKANALGLETLVIPYHRPELPVKTVKVIIPGTLHIWPQFALPRLYSCPLEQGWLAQKLTENDLNPHLLYV